MAPHSQPNDYFGNSDSESDGEFVGFTDGDLGRVTDGISVDDKSEDESEGVNNGNPMYDYGWLFYFVVYCY